MKECPVCKARCFDDMDVCYGCLHRFCDDEEREPSLHEEMSAALANSKMLQQFSFGRRSDVGRAPAEEGESRVGDACEPAPASAPGRPSASESESGRSSVSGPGRPLEPAFEPGYPPSPVFEPGRPSASASEPGYPPASASEPGCPPALALEQERPPAPEAAPGGDSGSTPSRDRCLASNNMGKRLLDPASDNMSERPFGPASDSMGERPSDCAIAPKTFPGGEEWVVRLGIPAGCEGVTVRLERAGAAS